MYARFKLFNSHIDLSHQYWNSLIKQGDTVIDATCGNGHDTLVLANLALTTTSGTLFALDVQPAAIESCKELLMNKLPKNIYNKIQFLQGCHSKFPEELTEGTVKVVVYNLGYLPGGNKSKTTTAQTTLQSLRAAQSLVQEGGLISITCYPGHEAGRIEEKEIIEYTSTLDPKTWSCCHHHWTNRRKSPSLLIIQKRSNSTTT